MATRRNARRHKPAGRQSKMESESNHQAAARYDENVGEFIEQADVDGLAREAKKALEGDETKSPQKTDEGGKPARR